MIEALACWGGSLPIEFIEKILKNKNEKIRLAGLELLKFKAHELSDKNLLEICHLAGLIL